MVGAELLAQLVAQGDVEIVHLTRRELPPTPGVEVRVVDFAALESTSLGAADVAFCTLGTTISKAGSREAFLRVDRDAVVAFAELAKRSGVKTFVLVTALGADPNSRVFYNKTKGQVEQALALLGFTHLVVLRPSILDGDRTESRPGEAVGLVVMRAFAPLMLGGLRRYRPSRASDVAGAMRSLAKSPGPAAVRFVEAEAIPGHSA